MKTVNHEYYTGHCRHAYSVARGSIAVLTRRGLSLLVAAAVWTGMACATSYAQTVIGSPGAGFQHWTAETSTTVARLFGTLRPVAPIKT